MINKLIQSKPMRYWSLSPNASQTQKDKLQKKLESDEYFATLKRDGCWYRFSKDENSGILLQSRTVSARTGDFVEKQDRVPSVIEQLQNIPPKTILIGEICYEDRSKTSSDIISIMGCLPKKAIERQKITPVHYYIFDILAYDGFSLYNLPAIKRIEFIQKLSEKFKEYDLLEFANPQFDNLKERVGEWIEFGEEGAVLMQKDKPYFFGDSPAWQTIKFKTSLLEDIDLVIMGVTPPVKEYTGKYPMGWEYWENLKTGELEQGRFWKNGGYLPVSSSYFNRLIGGFKVGVYYEDTLIEVGKIANLTDEIVFDATKNPEKYIGTVIQVSAMSIDQKRKSLRHAKLIRLRPDKNAKECLYNKIFS